MKNKTVKLLAMVMVATSLLIGCGKDEDVNNTSTYVNLNTDVSTENSNDIEQVKDDVAEVEQTTQEAIPFTDEELRRVDAAFTAFMPNEEYQTTVQKGDTLVYITFKDLGTVTFKMYDKTAPDAVEWFSSLVNENKEIEYSDKEHGTRMKDNSARWDFVTTERVYNRKEQVSEIFPMKYCLYQKLYSCNNFYICLSDYIENETDNANVPAEYLDYLKQYGGNFTLYEDCVVLGRAVDNFDILDQLDENFEITKIEVDTK